MHTFLRYIKLQGKTMMSSSSPIATAMSWVTPHKLVLTMMIEEIGSNISQIDDVDLLVFLTRKITIIESESEPTFLELTSILQKEVPSSHIFLQKVLRTRMKEIRSSLDGLVGFLDRVRSLLVSDEIKQPDIHPESVFGHFVRRLILYTECILFEGLTDLYDRFVKYSTVIEPPAAGPTSGCGGGGRLSQQQTNKEPFLFWRLKNPPSSPSSSSSPCDLPQTSTGHTAAHSFLSPSNADGGDDPDISIRPSSTTTPLIKEEEEERKPRQLASHEMEYFWKRQAQYIHLSLGLLHPDRVMDDINRIQSSYSHYLHFLRCLVSFFSRDWMGAIESSHEYFDFGTETFDPSSGRTCQNILPFAILDLSRIHIQYGHVTAGLQSLTESLCIAQERNDPVCLAFSLSWLLHIDWCALMDQENMQHHLLNRSVHYALERNLFQLAVKNSMFAAQSVFSDPTVRPGRDLFGTLPSIESGGGTERKSDDDAFSKLWNWIDFAALHSIQQSFLEPQAECHIARATSWQLCGQSDLSFLSSALALNYFARYTSTRNACVSLCNFALLSLEKGDQEWKDKALKMIWEEYPFVPIFHKSIFFQMMLIQLKQTLNRREWVSSELIASQMQSCLTTQRSERKMSSHRASFFLLSAQYLRQIGDFRGSSEALHYLLGNSFSTDPSHFIAQTSGEATPLQAIEYLLSLAETYFEADDLATRALPYSLTCLSLCQRFHSKPLLVRATVQLCRICLHLGKLSRCTVLLRDLKKAAVVHQCSYEIQGDFYLMLAKVEGAKMNLAAQKSLQHSSFSTKTVHHQQICEPLNKSVFFFSKTESIAKLIEAFHFQAVFFHSLGWKKERNTASKNFRKSMEELQTRQIH